MLYVGWCVVVGCCLLFVAGKCCCCCLLMLVLCAVGVCVVGWLVFVVCGLLCFFLIAVV